MRDSPAISVIQTLQDAGARIRAADPEGVEQARLVLNDVDFLDDPYAVADGADALVIVTEWDAFRALNLSRIAGLLKTPVLVDLRNIYPPEDVAAAGLHYHGVGKQEPLRASFALSMDLKRLAET
jgi:UDPglucose 6-dehydrogenase